MSQSEGPTLGQLLSSLTAAQAWLTATALATVLSGVAIGGFWSGNLVAENTSARQAQDDATAKLIAISDARSANEDAATWKGKYEVATAEVAAAKARAAQADAVAANTAAWYNTCAGQNTAIEALQSRLRSVDVDLGIAETNHRDQPDMAQGLREQQRILNEGLANCGLPKR